MRSGSRGGEIRLSEPTRKHGRLKCWFHGEDRSCQALWQARQQEIARRHLDSTPARLGQGAPELAGREGHFVRLQPRQSPTDGGAEDGGAIGV